MPTISEEELGAQEGEPCSNCNEYEGAIWLCGEGYLCERCFAIMAEIEEEELFDDEKPLDEFVIPDEQKDRAKANLVLIRGGKDGEG